MLRAAVLSWLIVTACTARAEEQTDSGSGTDTARLTVGGVLLSDYIYRGISYSGRHPSVGAYVEAQRGWLYAATYFNSVKFSTQAASELTMVAGLRPTMGPFEFDIGAGYYYYPGEIGPERSNYWEAHATVAYKPTETVTLGMGLNYAPNVWQSGAWGTYAVGSFALDLPNGVLPPGVGWTLSADAGRSLFGPTSPSGGGVNADAGGLPLPAYTNWRAGLTFSYSMFKLALNYTDTTLSKENCYVLTGDLAAIAGGVINPGNNPTGLRSNLCGAVFSATLGFDITPSLR
jgi:uncharacterized protein (TIGR02001 family)